MEFHKIVFDKYFDATFEQVFEVIEKYLDKLSEEKPELGLSVTVEEKTGKKVWRGNLMEGQDWPKPDIDYGYIEIVPAYLKSIKPMLVKMYCSRPEYLGYWSGLSKTLLDLLPLFDESLIPAGDLSNLIPDELGYDQELLNLWKEGYTAKEIKDRLHVSPSRIYGRLGELRNKLGVDKVPYKREDKKQHRKKQ